MTPLQNRLVLHRFVCRAFGCEGMTEMLDRLRGAPAAFDAGGASEYARAFYLNPERARVAPERFAEYDANIAALSRRLRMAGEHGRSWKPHQWLALLFTEHYLDRYFADAGALREDLDRARRADPRTRSLPEYEPDDLRTLAFQSATGSGKTLLMHAHILQYRHYLDRAGRRLNNVVLLTPNEQMSAQHERELRDSGLHARLFSSEAGTDLLAPVEIVDLNKLAERKGVKRVAVADFGDDNLVLVDEGHLGASGKVWRERRKELARGGFAFEYSATFNQIVGGDDALLRAYGKCILFDYAYRAFYEEGYGKDYAILNLPGGAEDENSDMYLLGCLLTFYQQCRLWRDKGASWAEFNPAKPLWAFLGKTVTKSGAARADVETRSDVVRILRFLGRVLAHGDAMRPMIARLLDGRSGLLDEDGGDCFAGRFSHLPPSGEDLYPDLCETLFHGPGRLRVVHTASGDGELHLRSADHEPFGVVNVGDSQALWRLLADDPGPDLDAERERGFVEPLFAAVDRPDSPVNLVIGARRFIAGWNSWRVSVMGLMHVGVGEGPEIIQMFGRGVRLKGWRGSLKRHRESGAPPPEDADGLAELETLRIFGLRANYMQTFRDLLTKEGALVEQATVRLPVTWNFARAPDLKMIRLEKGARYDRSDERAVLPPPDGRTPPVELDLYSRLQTAASGDGADAAGSGRETARIERRHIAFFDRTRIYDKLLARKQRMGWDNLAIGRETVDRLLDDDGWYVLRAPPERLAARRFDDLRKLEELAVELIAEYADRFWRRSRSAWEHGRIEVTTLDESDPNNIGAYRLSMDASRERLIEDAASLAGNLRDGIRLMGLTVLVTDAHAYKPLLHANASCPIDVRPVVLDDAEKIVVERLAALAGSGAPCLEGRELFLLRNLSRGRGVSFFDDYAYYPDFIVWLTDGDAQHLLFLDPKGPGRFGPRERRKVALHREIAAAERRVRESEPHLRLHAYVLSVTPPHEIGDEPRTRPQWEADSVYFLDRPDSLERLVGRALAAEEPERTRGGERRHGV